MDKLQTTRKRQQIPPPEKKKGLPEEPPKKQIHRSPHPEKSKDEPTVRGTALSLNESKMPMSSDVFFAECSVLGAANSEQRAANLSPKTPKTKTSHLVLRPYGMAAQILATHIGAKKLAALRVS